MSYFIQPVITNKAISEVASAIQSNQTLTFTRLALGTGKQTGDIKTITNLAKQWKNLDVSVTTVDNTFKVLSRLNNNDLSQETHITELGLFAKVGTSPEFLYLYTSADQGDLVPDNTQGAYVRTYFLETTISNDGTLDVDYVTGSDTFASQEDLLTHIQDTNNPHIVTKEDVGLGNVENYGIATTAEAKAGTSDDKLMTPKKVKDVLSAIPLASSTEDGLMSSSLGPTTSNISVIFFKDSLTGLISGSVITNIVIDNATITPGGLILLGPNDKIEITGNVQNAVSETDISDIGSSWMFTITKIPLSGKFRIQSPSKRTLSDGIYKISVSTHEVYSEGVKLNLPSTSSISAYVSPVRSSDNYRDSIFGFSVSGSLSVLIPKSLLPAKPTNIEVIYKLEISLVR